MIDDSLETTIPALCGPGLAVVGVTEFTLTLEQHFSREAVRAQLALPRLPGAPDLDAFWSLLAEGRDAVTTVPPDRFDQARWGHPRKSEPGRSYTFAAGTIGDATGFDAAAFGVSPREAAEMDPQQRFQVFDPLLVPGS